MARRCNICDTELSESTRVCPECEAVVEDPDTDEFGTIPPAGGRGRKPVGTRGRGLDSADDDAPAASQPKPVKKKVKAANTALRVESPAQPQVQSRPAAPAPRPSSPYQPPPPRQTVPSQPVAPQPQQPVYPPQNFVVTAPAPAPAPGGVRSMLIRLLGGATPAAPPAPPALYREPEAYEEFTPPHAAAAPYRGQGQQAPSAYPLSSKAPPAASPVQGAGLPPFVPPSQRPPMPDPMVQAAPPSYLQFDNDQGPADELDDETRYEGGLDVDRLNFAKESFMLQLFDRHGNWRDWGAVTGRERNVGRKGSGNIPGLNTMAERHLRLFFDKRQLCVEDLGSLNGVYLRIQAPVPLSDGTRFRVGRHVLEFHEVEPSEAAPPSKSDDGEEFCGRDMEPLAYIDVLRSDGVTGVRFPVTREATVIGRESRKNPQHESVTISLTGDTSASVTHARVVRHEGTFYLDDLGSRNGTYIHLVGKQALRSGDELMAGTVRLRVEARGGG